MFLLLVCLLCCLCCQIRGLIGSPYLVRKLLKDINKHKRVWKEDKKEHNPHVCLSQKSLQFLPWNLVCLMNDSNMKESLATAPLLSLHLWVNYNLRLSGKCYRCFCFSCYRFHLPPPSPFLLLLLCLLSTHYRHQQQNQQQEDYHHGPQEGKP